MSETPAPSPTPDPESPAGEPAPERQTTPFLVLQFFIFPMAIVAVCVTVFVVFGLVASEGKGPRDYLNEVRTGSTNRRWQAAFELSKVLQAKKDPALRDPRFVAELVALFDQADKDDPRVRRYLALALGRLGDRRAVPSLLKVVEHTGPDADVETLIYAIWALGSIADPDAVPQLAKLASNEEHDIRKAAVHALGVFPGEAAQSAVAAAIADPVEDVRWNAAVALAHRGDARATPVLLQMMDRSHLAGVEGMTAEQQDEAVEQAVAAAAGIDDASLRAAIQQVREKDPSLKVREAARVALEAKK